MGIMAFYDRYFYINRDEIQPVDNYQLKIILDALGQCSDLPIKNYEDINFCWCSELDDNDEDISAAFVPYRRDSIFIKHIENPFNSIPSKHRKNLTQKQKQLFQQEYKERIVQIVPYICHEMTHMAQLEKYGRFRYGIYSTILFYNKILEPEAFAREISAAIDLGLDKQLYGRC